MRTLWIGAAIAASSASGHVMEPVVKLLRGMQAQLEKNAKADEKMNKKITCKNDKDIADTKHIISTEEANIKRLKEEIAEAIAKTTELQTKLKIRKEERDKLVSERQEAKGARDNETGSFIKQQDDLNATIAALGQAIKLLSANDYKLLAQVRVATRKVIDRVPQTPKVVSLTKLVNALPSSETFLQTSPYQNYAAQSSQIFGMLDEMKIQFTQDLNEAISAEAKALAAWTEYDINTGKMIKSARANINDTLKPGIATAMAKKSQGKQDLDLSETTFGIATVRLSELEVKAAADKEHYDRRVKSRNEEITAIMETIEILDDPAAFENMGKTKQALVETSATSFLQVTTPTSYVNMDKVVQMLEGSKMSPEVMLVQAYAKVGAFDKILNAIAGVLKKISREGRRDKKALDQCAANQQTLSKELLDNQNELDEVNIALKKLNLQIKKTKNDIEKDQDDHATENEDVKMAASDRAEENDTFQTELRDQRTTINTLDRAIARLRQKYGGGGGGGGGLVQESASTEEEPAFDAKGDSNNPGGNRAVTLLTKIRAGAKKAEQDMIMSERLSQQAYEKTTQTANVLIVELEKKIVAAQALLAGLVEEHATKEKEKVLSEESVEKSTADLKAEQADCKFVEENYALREGERAAEKVKLQSAIETIKELKPAKPAAAGPVPTTTTSTMTTTAAAGPVPEKM